jgi:hypothetical protein
MPIWGVHIASERGWVFIPTRRTTEAGIYKASGETVLYGEAGRCRTRAYPKLVVDGVEVSMDGAGTEEEPFCDLGVGEPFGNKP